MKLNMFLFLCGQIPLLALSPATKQATAVDDGDDAHRTGGIYGGRHGATVGSSFRAVQLDYHGQSLDCSQTVSELGD